jgi:hypothetical protein
LSGRISTPNDARWSEQWDMVKIAAPAAWDTQTGSPDVVVAVIDTGIDFSHPELQANLWTNPLDGAHGYSCLSDPATPGGQDDNGHGTHVAGTIGAAGDNGAGIAGLNWSVQLLSLKAFDSYGTGYVSNIIRCIDKMTELRQNGFNIRVSNNSWSVGTYSQALRDALARAGSAGVLHVCAAGNSSLNLDTMPSYPAAFPDRGILTVAATDANDVPASFTNFGLAGVDLAAPGKNTLSTVPTGTCESCDASGYKLLSGTSMAAPHVTGVAAALFQRNPALTPEQARDILLDPASVDPLTDNSSRSSSSTHARLNFAKAINNPLVSAPQRNGFPQISAAPLVVRSAGNPANLTATATDPDGDPLQVCEPPVPDLVLDKTSGPAPLTVSYDAQGSYDPEGTALTFYPDCEAWSSSGYMVPGPPAGTCTFDTPGPHTVSVFVLDAGGYAAERLAYVMVTPPLPPDTTAPAVALTAPAAGANVTGLVTVAAAAQDEVGTIRVDFFLDSSFLATDTAAPFGITWDSSVATAGSHTLSARAYDQAGNSAASAAVQVNVTNSAPLAVSVTSPVAGSSVAGAVTVHAAVSANAGVTRVEIYRDAAVLLGTATTAPYEVLWNAGTAPGSHTLYAKASGQAGSSATSATVQVTALDLIPPAASLTAPANNATLSGTVNVTAAASDAGGVARIDFLRDGALLASDTTAPYAITWNTSVETPGSHVLTARAYDQAGNSASAAVQVTLLDSAPPAVAVTSPAAGSSIAGQVTLHADATDNVGVTRVELYRDGAVLLGTVTAAPYDVLWTVDVAPGSHTLYAKAYDQAGNAGTSAAVQVTAVGSLTVSLTAPANGATLSGAVSVTATATGPGGVARVDFLRDGSLLASDTTAPYAITWDSSMETPGSHTLSARAYDPAGSSVTSAAVQVTLLDSAPPAVAITSPAAGTSITGAITVHAVASDNVGVTKVELYRDNAIPLWTSTAPPYDMPFDSTYVDPGTHTLYAKAYDQAGNVRTSALLPGGAGTRSVPSVHGGRTRENRSRWPGLPLCLRGQGRRSSLRGELLPDGPEPSRVRRSHLPHPDDVCRRPSTPWRCRRPAVPASQRDGP